MAFTNKLYLIVLFLVLLAAGTYTTMQGLDSDKFIGNLAFDVFLLLVLLANLRVVNLRPELKMLRTGVVTLTMLPFFFLLFATAPAGFDTKEGLIVNYLSAAVIATGIPVTLQSLFVKRRQDEPANPAKSSKK